MKTQTKKELHVKTISELRRQLIDTKEALRALNLDKEMGKIKNTSELRAKRLEIAVVSTILNEKAAIERLVKLEKEADVQENVLKADKSAAVKTKEVKRETASAKAKADEEGGKK
jgi:ribosomal protein L29